MVDSLTLYRLEDKLELAFCLDETSEVLKKKRAREVANSLSSASDPQGTIVEENFKISYLIRSKVFCLGVFRKTLSDESLAAFLQSVVSSFENAHKNEEVDQAKEKFKFIRFGFSMGQLKDKFEKEHNDKPATEKAPESPAIVEKSSAGEAVPEVTEKDPGSTKKETKSKPVKHEDNGKTAKGVEKGLEEKEVPKERGLTPQVRLSSREDLAKVAADDDEEEEGEEEGEEDPIPNDSPFRDPVVVLFEKILEGDPTFALIKFAQIVKTQRLGRFEFLGLANKLIIFATKFIDDPNAMNLAIMTFRACEILEPSECELAVAKKKSSSFTTAYQKIKDLLNESEGVI